jgi:hypothetical protein
MSIQITVFWDVTSCSLVHRHKCFRGTAYLHIQVGSDGVPLSSLKMEVAGFSKTLVPMYQTTWDCISEDCDTGLLSLQMAPLNPAANGWRIKMTKLPTSSADI